MSTSDDISKKYFVQGSLESEWYIHLSHDGSCHRLLQLLKDNPKLLRETGEGNVTVLDKAVRHGCDELVRHVMFQIFETTGVSFCDGIDFTRENLLRKTNDNHLDAVTLAALIGSRKVVKVLKEAVDMCAKNQARVEVVRICDWKNLDYSSICKVHTSRSVLVEHAGSSSSNNLSELHASEDLCSRFSPLAPLIPTVSQSLNSAGDKDIPQVHSSKSLDKTAHMYRRINLEILEIIRGHADPTIRELILLCEKDVNFNFVPAEDIFFHFLCNLGFHRVPQGALQMIKDKVRSWRADQIIALFIHQDPQGRTPLHVAVSKDTSSDSRTKDILKLIPLGGTFKSCVNARDGAGRTPLHRACMGHHLTAIESILEDSRTDLTARIRPTNYDELWALLNWRSPHAYQSTYKEENHCTALHLAVLHDNTEAVHALLKTKKVPVNACIEREFDCPACPPFVVNITPLHLAAAMGHLKPLIALLKDKRVFDKGFKDRSWKPVDWKAYEKLLPALHWAAAYGDAEAIQTILKCKNYDPQILNWHGRSALHFAVYGYNPGHDLLLLQDLLPYGTLENLESCLRINSSDLLKGNSSNEIACINLLLQAGNDLWSTDKDGREPHPGPSASSEATKWWYDKVTSGVEDMNNNLSNAANVTSVIAALVGTASFIGPLQPPLDMASTGAWDLSPVKMYFVCNGLSFYLAVASISLAVIPQLSPMRKESIHVELQRSRGILKVATGFLLISIVCLLFSFATASVAITPSQWKDRQPVVFTIMIGALACFFVMIVFCARLFRQTFHHSKGVRRFYEKYWKL